STKELRMYSQVEIEWKAPDPRSKAMKLETLELFYREAAATISLMPWARLTRDNTVIEAGNTVVTLKDGAIRLIEAQKARGTDRYPQRQLQYAADQLSVHYGDTGVVEKVSGQTNARLVSTS